MPEVGFQQWNSNSTTSPRNPCNVSSSTHQRIYRHRSKTHRARCGNLSISLWQRYGRKNECTVGCTTFLACYLNWRSPMRVDVACSFFPWRWRTNFPVRTTLLGWWLHRTPITNKYFQARSHFTTLLPLALCIVYRFGEEGNLHQIHRFRFLQQEHYYRDKQYVFCTNIRILLTMNSLSAVIFILMPYYLIIILSLRRSLVVFWLRSSCSAMSISSSTTNRITMEHHGDTFSTTIKKKQ